MSFVVPESPEQPSTAPKLGQVCGALGQQVLEILVAPRGLDAPVEGVMIHEPGLELRHYGGPGQMILAVGAHADDPHSTELIRQAGAAEAAGIVFRRRHAPAEPVLDGAVTTGVALLTTAPQTAWGELYELIGVSLAAHRAGPSAVSGAGDLFALADATAALAGGPVNIEDPQSRLLAFSRGGQDLDEGRAATILERRVPERWLQYLRRAGVLDHLATSTEPVRVQPGDLRPRRAIAIRAGATVLGSIWLAGDDADLSPHADEALREAAQIAALHLVRHQVVTDLDQRSRSIRLDALLRGDPASAQLLAELDLPDDAALAVCLIGSDVGETLPERLVGLLGVHLRVFGHRAQVTPWEDRVAIVASCPDAAAREALIRNLEDGLQRARHTLGLPLRAGMSTPIAPGDSVAEARRNAEQALRLGGRDDVVVPFEAVHAAALLADVDALLADRPPSPALAVLRRHDEEQRTEYVRTLRAFLEALGDSQAAAQRLHVHVNTVRYRLRRIGELVDVRLDDGTSRLALELELRVAGD